MTTTVEADGCIVGADGELQLDNGSEPIAVFARNTWASCIRGDEGATTPSPHP